MPNPRKPGQYNFKIVNGWAIQALGAYIGKGFRLHKKQNKQLRVTNIVGGRLNVFTNCVIGGVFI